MEEFEACFSDLEDPRDSNARHDLLEILVIAQCTMLCGGEDCTDMELFGRAKEPFLRQFLRLPHGIPSHDTFSRVFRLLDPVKFHACFLHFMQLFAETTQGVVAIDGKTLRHSFDRAAGSSALHLISAWAADQRLMLGQLAVDDKSNEITAVPKLLEMLSLKGTIVTADALNCQRDIARQIVDQGGDYVLALKGNQGTLTSPCSWTTRSSLPTAYTRPSMVTTGASRPGPLRSPTILLGYRSNMLGQAWRPSARSIAAVRSAPRSPPRPPTTCSVRRSPPIASAKSPEAIGASKTACIGSSMSP